MEEIIDLLKEYEQSPLTRDEFNGFKEWIVQHKTLKLQTREEGSHNDENADIRLFDAKVKCWGPDDKIYCSTTIPDNKRIRDEITRGCILLFISNKKTQKKEFIIYQGFAKFSGLTDQDDDDLAKLQEKEKRSGVKQKEIEKDVFYTEPIENCDHVVQINKENGKAAHFGCFKVNDVKYYVCGSKNVHIVFRNKQDLLLKFKSDNILHVKFCHMILEELSGLDKAKREEFLDMLCSTNLLCNFEVMLKEDQHIVDYDFKEGKPFIFRFLTMTGRRSHNTAYKRKFGKLFPVDVSLKYAKYIGFETPSFSLYTLDDEKNRKATMEKVISSIRLQGNSEGCVLYFMRGLKTIGLAKSKYIFFRAIREKIKRKPYNFNFLIEKRFKDIKKWLKLDDNSIKEWRIIAFHFYNYVKKTLEKDFKADAFKNQYADLVAAFMKTYKKPEDLDGEIEKIFDEKAPTDPAPVEKKKKKKKKRKGR